jgi:hypothetical protein
MGMQFFSGGVGHKSMHAATDHFLRDHNHTDLDIDGQHNSVDNNMDWEDEVDASPIAEGNKLNGDDDYRYGDPLDELEDVASVDSEDDCSSEEDGALVLGGCHSMFAPSGLSSIFFLHC